LVTPAGSRTFGRVPRSQPPTDPLARRARRLAAAVLAAAASVAAPALQVEEAIASVCAAADAQPSRSGPLRAERSTLCLINDERRARGLHPLRSDARLAEAAARHSGDMTHRHFFSHTSPGGSTFVRRIRRSGYLKGSGRWRVGQVLAWGIGSGGSPRAVVRAWMESPPHRRVLLRSGYREAGIGVVLAVPDGPRPNGATYTTDLGLKEAFDAR
jgi:uncharacterized protein YkwD